MLKCEELNMSQGAFQLSADVAFPLGQITAIMGPSGAGKSTLLSAIAGFVTPQSGQVLWHDRVISGLAPGKRPVSILFQDNNLFPHLTAFENVKLGLPKGHAKAKSSHQQISDVLGQVGLGDLHSRKPAQLSGGQQSRVGIARIMIAARPVVLLDEPFAALGPGLKAEMLTLIRKMLLDDPSMCVVMVTHDPEDAKHAADLVAWVDQGHVAQPAPVDRFFAQPSAAVAQYLGTIKPTL